MSSFVSNFVRKFVTGETLPDFPYVIGEQILSANQACLWHLNAGTKRDGTKVSIFVFDGTKQMHLMPLARNMYRRMKTLRHPALLQLLDGKETSTHIYIATNEVVPLLTILNEVKKQTESIALGIYQLLRALNFLNGDCSLMHGNVFSSTIFVEKSGDWKLGGFEFSSSLQEESPIIMNFAQYSVDLQRCRPPEVLKGGWSIIRSNPVWTVDVWLLGCLIYSIFNEPVVDINRLKIIGSIPQKCYDFYKEMINEDAKRRIDSTRCLEIGCKANGYFTNSLIHVADFLENIAIKEVQEKEHFFRKLEKTLEALPIDFQKGKLLPELINCINFGGANHNVVDLLLKIGNRFSEEEYFQKIVPAVIKLFSINDRGVRMSLLENLEKYITRLPVLCINDNIFQHLCAGFNDTMPILREETVKSMIHFAPKLSERNFNDLLRHFSKMQMDNEPGIRANTTICLGRISRYLSEPIKSKVLIPAFSRTFKDPFPHARIAGVMAFATTIEFYSDSDCSIKILPLICGLLLDSEKEVRNSTFKAFDLYYQRIRTRAKEMDFLPNEVNEVSQHIEPVEGWISWAVTSLSKTFEKTNNTSTDTKIQARDLSEQTALSKTHYNQGAVLDRTKNWNTSGFLAVEEPSKMFMKLSSYDIEQSHNLIDADVWEPFDSTIYSTSTEILHQSDKTASGWDGIDDSALEDLLKNSTLGQTQSSNSKVLLSNIQKTSNTFSQDSSNLLSFEAANGPDARSDFGPNSRLLQTSRKDIRGKTAT